MFINFEFPPLLFYLRSNPDTFLPGAVHVLRETIDFFDILFVFEGTLHLWEDGDTFDIGPGEFLILEPNKKHYGYRSSTEKTHYYWLHFQTTGYYFTSKTEPLHLAIDQKHHLLSFPKFGTLNNVHLVYEQLKEMSKLHTYSNSLQKHQQQMIFQQMIPQLLLNRTHQKESHQVIQVAESCVRFLEQNFMNEIDYRTISEQLNFTSTYVTRCLKKVYGITPLDYLKKIRIEEAKFDLLHTDLSIETIAFRVGYSSISYFSRIFSKEVGLSPIQYRKLYQTQAPA